MKVSVFLKRNWGRALFYSFFLYALIGGFSDYQRSRDMDDWTNLMGRARASLYAKHYGRALARYQEAIELSKDLDDNRQKESYRGLAYLYFSWGQDLSLDKDYSGSFEKFTTALDVIIKNDANSYQFASHNTLVPATITVSRVYQSLCHNASSQDQYSEAEYYLIQAIAAQELEPRFEPHPMSYHARNLEDLADLYIQRGNMEGVLFLQEKAQRLGYEHTLKHIDDLMNKS